MPMCIQPERNLQGKVVAVVMSLPGETNPALTMSFRHTPLDAYQRMITIRHQVVNARNQWFVFPYKLALSRVKNTLRPVDGPNCLLGRPHCELPHEAKIKQTGGVCNTNTARQT